MVKTLPAGEVKGLVGHSQDMDTFGVYGHTLTGEAEATAEAVNGIYFLVNIIPVVTCALELIGVGLIFNLNKETTEQMYAELKAK